MRPIYLVSAPGALATTAHPVGGGVRILELLAASLAPRAAVTIVTAGATAREYPESGVRRVQLPLSCLEGEPADRVLTFSAFQYARFSVEFEAAATTFLLREATRDGAVVVCNDIAEGPNFGRLADAGVPMVTLFHVVVADFFSRMYLKELVRAGTVVRGLRRLERWGLGCLVPRIPRLVFQKEGAAVARSAALVVPSRGMGEAITAAFPGTDPARIHVVPWGVTPTAATGDEVAHETAALRAEYGLTSDTRVLLTMSRLSGEKGLELLLEALARLDADAGPPVLLLLGGQGAYMGGEGYVRRLQRQAARLRRVRVRFPGYLTGARKLAHFALAHLFVNCSKYEAYGLAIGEALHAGLPVLSTAHYGSRDLIRPGFGEIVETRDAEAFAGRLRGLLADPARLADMGRAARVAGAALTFDLAAERLYTLIEDAAARREATAARAR